MSTPKKTAATHEINFNSMLQAIKNILVEKKGIRSTARYYGIQKSTLQRYKKKVEGKFEDISKVKHDILMEFIRTTHIKVPPNQVFPIAQEKELVEYIIKCVNHYYGLSIDELRQLAFQLAKKLGIEYPPSWDKSLKASRGWYYLFMKRHPELTLRTPEQTSLNRIKAFCKANADKFFANLGRLLDEFKFESGDIYNMDESGFSNVPTKIGKVIALKGMCRVGKAEAAERGTTVTMALTVSASGNSIPPFFLFPRKNIQSCFLDKASSGSAGFANDSGWMCQPDFVRYIRHFINFVRPSKERPVLLLMDNHTSHMSVEALDIASANGVHILSFPPHCSHKMQPLDVSVFGPIKTYYKSQCSAWQKTNANKVLEIRHIAGIVCATLDLALKPITIKLGFAATGIFPYNPYIFSDVDFVQAVEQNAKLADTDANLNEDEQRRIVVGDALNVGRKEEVTTSEPSTSRSASVMLSAVTSFSSILDKIGPLQDATPKKPSKRGRKAMESCELTSPQSIAALKEKATIKAAAAGKKTKTPSIVKKSTPPAKQQQQKEKPKTPSKVKKSTPPAKQQQKKKPKTPSKVKKSTPPAKHQQKKKQKHHP